MFLLYFFMNVFDPNVFWKNAALIFFEIDAFWKVFACDSINKIEFTDSIDFIHS